MKYSGIDLHSNNSVVTVMDEADRVVAEKRLPNDLAKIVGFLSCGAVIVYDGQATSGAALFNLISSQDGNATLARAYFGLMEV